MAKVKALKTKALNVEDNIFTALGFDLRASTNLRLRAELMLEIEVLKPGSDETGECGVSFFEWSVGSLADGPYISESIFSAIEMSIKKTILKFV